MVRRRVLTRGKGQYVDAKLFVGGQIELTVVLWRAMASSSFAVSSICESSCESLESGSW